jgi:uncharacterized protein YndB with AHSA1/START domain
MAHEIRITRTIPAPRGEVYDAWTEAESLVQWMIPLPQGRTRAQLDVRVGGRFRIEMFGGGQTYPHEGEYLQLERPALIEFTWISAATQGLRSVVRVELRELSPDCTELTLTQRELPSEQACDEHRTGWTAALDLLEREFFRARA